MKYKTRVEEEVKYKAWLFSFGYRSGFKPFFDSFIGLLQKQVFLAVVLITFAIGFRYYVLDLGAGEMDAVASSADVVSPGIVSSGIVSSGIVSPGMVSANALSSSSVSANAAVLSSSLPALSSISGEINRSSGQASRSEDQHRDELPRINTLSESENLVADNNIGNKIENSASNDTALEHAGKHADPTYVCPMHSSVVSKEGGQTCPICGMDLVVVEMGGEAGVVSISPRIINMLGVRVSKVKKKTLYRRIDSVGNIQYDENKISHIHLRTDGWVEQLTVKALGDRVEKGDLLFSLYSPKLVNAQEELLQSIDMGNDVLTEASRERLRSLGMSASQISSLEKTNQIDRLVKYFAPHGGIVSDLKVREGMFVKPSKLILSLVDMSSIWLVANIFESQSDWVKVGNKAEASLSFMPDKTWEGKVEHVYPILDQKTRSLEVRLRFDNPDEMLKANMYANVKIYAKPKRKALSIPTESLIRTGDGDRVIVSLGDGKFKPVSVRTGIESNNRTEILGGLNEGDSVVVSSQFLIDSESSLRASLMRMSGS